ncbi:MULTISPECIES: site-specific integrase [Vibrio]|uniref:site-specific integrase n=1 Tax=Vibrio TaxID=662 RepID=UPI000B53985B|nr:MULTISPECIES: site-specific integrase [Vibrio]ASG02622.1 integrase [Vibrio anguillarum]NGZ65840.1 site-specific integrase [Vibrio aestuarianus subsp. cardii]
MAEIIYDIKTKTIKHFTYRKPSVFIDENGEPQYKYSPNKDNYTHIKKVIFLSLVGYEKVNLLDENDKPIKDEHGNPIFVKGDLVSYEPMNYVNELILAKHVVDEKEDAQQASKALTHYFRFILDAQTKWDDKYDNEDYDPLIDPPRPAWDNFSPRKNLRVTTMYRNAVKKATLDGTGLAKTTAMSYVRSMIDFYKYHLRQGMRFNNPPFKFETLLIDLETSGTDMKARKCKEIQTTDLKLTFPKSKKNDGGKLPNSNRELKPLTNSEWREIKNILGQTRRVLKNVKSEEKLVSLPEEYCLLFRLLRYTGLRKEEGTSLHLGQIIRPNTNGSMLRLGVGNQYGSLTKDPNGGYNNKSRRTIIPSSLMLELYNYSHSPRYKKRLAKFRERCRAEREAGNDAYFDGVDGVDEDKQYLFISNSGVPLFKKLEEINTRWNEVRKTAGMNLLNDIDAVVHNLRATFAVSIFRTLLKKMNPDDALARVSALLGHEDLSTTLLYLKIAQEEPTGDEIWEDVLDYLGVFDEEEELDNLPEVEQTYKHEASL